MDLMLFTSESIKSGLCLGTFYYNQLAALQILVGDKDGAKQTIEKYFTSQYKNQIAANGDQVRPRHAALPEILPHRGPA